MWNIIFCSAVNIYSKQLLANCSKRYFRIENVLGKIKLLPAKMSLTPSTPSTPGSQAIANYKSREVVEFKKPTQVVAKKKPKILTEEKYIEELSKIIQRDFFPDLEKLKAQNDYLDAMDRKDYTEMQRIRAQYSGVQHTERARSMTPATFETPEAAVNSTPRPKVPSNTDTPNSTISSASTSSKADGRDKSLSEKHSLDSFLEAYTSEDNFSFQEIVDAAEEKLRQKFAVLYNEEQISHEQLAKALDLPSIEQQFDKPDPMRKIETWTYKNKNSIMYIPDGVELTEKERIERVNFKQTIQHSATRLQTNPFVMERSQQAMSETSKAHTQILSGKIGVDGNVVVNNANAAPQIRGFNLVKTPSPRPGEAFSPLMTWGEIEGTPFRLDGSDTPVRSNVGPSFHINENSRRENIAIALAEKVGEKMRAQKQKAKDAARKNINSPFIRSNMERLATMSPAARRLATSKLGLRTPLMTPTPTRTPILTRKRKGGNYSAKNTPVVGKTPGSMTATTNATKSTLTDDLLKIPTKPKRPSAADFF